MSLPSLYSKAAYSFLEAMDCVTLVGPVVGWFSSSVVSPSLGPMLKAVAFLVMVPELEIGICDVFGCPCTGLARGLAGRKGTVAFVLPAEGTSGCSFSSS